MITTASDEADAGCGCCARTGITRDPWLRQQTRTLGHYDVAAARVQGQPGRPAGRGRRCPSSTGWASCAPAARRSSTATTAGSPPLAGIEPIGRPQLRPPRPPPLRRADRPGAGRSRPRPLRRGADGREHLHRPALPARAHADLVPREPPARVAARDRAGGRAGAVAAAGGGALRRRTSTTCWPRCASCTPRSRGEPAARGSRLEAVVSAVVLLARCCGRATRRRIWDTLSGADGSLGAAARSWSTSRRCR